MFQVFAHFTELSSERIANLLLLTCANLLMCKFAHVSKFSPYEWGFKYYVHMCIFTQVCKFCRMNAIAHMQILHTWVILHMVRTRCKFTFA